MGGAMPVSYTHLDVYKRQIGGCLTNCVLDYIAIFHLDMGVFGAAVATGISQLATCISYFIHFFSKKCTFRLRKFRFDPRLYARMLPIGLSDGVTELCTGLMIFLFNRTVLKLSLIHICISIAEEETQIVVRVADSGCGIPEEYRRSIFQPFFRRCV